MMQNRDFIPLFRSKTVLRSRGKQTIKDNIIVAKTIADMVRTSLGPKGMKKLLVTKTGETVMTADGASLLKKMDFSLIFDHPIANILVEAAKAQDKNVGDGTSTVVVLIGELAWKAGRLIDIGLHPHSIIRGYGIALRVALEKLQDIALHTQIELNSIKNLATTSMNSKDLGLANSNFPMIIADAFMNILEKKPDGSLHIDIDNIKILKVQGREAVESELIKGVVVDEKVAHPLMPKHVSDARIALINEPLGIKRRKDTHTFLMSANIVIRDPENIGEFVEEEKEIIREKVEKLISVGANVILTPKRISDLSKWYLSKAGILAVERVRTTDMGLLMKICGGKTVADVDDLSESDLGYADIVEERLIGDKRWVFVLNKKGRGAISIILRGNSERYLNDLEQVVRSCLGSLSVFLKDSRVVPGGGATELALATAIKHEATKYPGKEQLAIVSFAAGLEKIVMTLAENFGLDPIDTLTSLRSRHENGEHRFGIDARTGEINDMIKLGIVEPYFLKEHALKTAYEAVSLLLRIGEVVTVPDQDKKKDNR